MNVAIFIILKNLGCVFAGITIIGNKKRPVRMVRSLYNQIASNLFTKIVYVQYNENGVTQNFILNESYAVNGCFFSPEII